MTHVWERVGQMVAQLVCPLITSDPCIYYSEDLSVRVRFDITLHRFP